MRDIEELRHALDTETAQLTISIGPERIRRRARGLRARRLATMTAAGAVALAAVAMPTLALIGAPPWADVGAPPSGPTLCLPAQAPDSGPRPLGPFADTAAVLDAPNLGTTFTVEFGLTGEAAHPGYAVSFRDQRTGVLHAWDLGDLYPGPGGFRGKREEDPPLQFLSHQLVLGPNRVLDLGFYAHAAPRITVSSEGHATDARLLANAETGWTLFWVERTATPLPLEATTTTFDYNGPEKVTLTAFDGAGNQLHTTTMGPRVGLATQNPRDHSPSGDPAAGTPDC